MVEAFFPLKLSISPLQDGGGSHSIRRLPFGATMTERNALHLATGLSWARVTQMNGDGRDGQPSNRP